jgi:hypothetical protein
MRAGGIPKDEGMWWYITGDHRSSANEREFTNCHPATDHRSTTDRCAVAHQRLSDIPIISGLEFACWSNGARKQVIGETDVRANKNAIFQRDTREDGRVILNLDPRADPHVRIDIDTFPDIALFADPRMLTHLRLTPDACSRAHLRR